jgi:hypothetical protein
VSDTIQEPVGQSSPVDCPERDRLIDAAATAADWVDAALKADRMRMDFVLEIQAARKAERSAVRALEEHRKTHGC